MKHFHELHHIIADHCEIKYFYKREKRDVNGNARFRVYIIDPDAPQIVETIFKCYESQIKSQVKHFITEETKHEATI